jgi:hypothetical protein
MGSLYQSEVPHCIQVGCVFVSLSSINVEGEGELVSLFLIYDFIVLPEIADRHIGILLSGGSMGGGIL